MLHQHVLVVTHRVFLYVAARVELVLAVAMLHAMGQALSLSGGHLHRSTRHNSCPQPGPATATAAINDHTPAASGIGTSTAQASDASSMRSNQRRSRSFLARVLGRVPTDAPRSDRTEKHLIVLVNGLWGSPSNWTVVKEKLRDHLDPQEFVVHASNANTGLATYSGIDICGQRLAGV